MKSNIWSKFKLFGLIFFLIFFNSIVINVKGSEQPTNTVTATQISTITTTFDSDVKVNDQTRGQYRTEIVVHRK